MHRTRHATLAAASLLAAAAFPLTAALPATAQEAAPQADTGAQADPGGDLERSQRVAEAEAGPGEEPAVLRSQAEREAAPEPAEEPLNHEGQMGVRAGIAVPYVFAVKYGEGPPCDDAGETFCRRFGAPLFELELGFGVSDTVELGATVRIGLTDDEAADARPLGLMLGARAYLSPDGLAKIYLAGRLEMDITSSDTPDWKTVDVGARGELGLQIDVLRYLGVYLQIGESFRFLRGFYFVTDGSGGLQLRFP
jgi:hypothetical protein